MFYFSQETFLHFLCDWKSFSNVAGVAYQNVDSNQILQEQYENNRLWQPY
jgi:hypothetical protein